MSKIIIQEKNLHGNHKIGGELEVDERQISLAFGKKLQIVDTAQQSSLYTFK